MIHPIQWLHISDFHMRKGDLWSEDLVLKAMCEEVTSRCAHGEQFNFILATGDLAFSGQPDEYKLVGEFFKSLSKASRVPLESIFCVPGNHDIDRQQQNMSFQGARLVLRSQSQIDSLLSPDDDLKTLLKREENYRSFQFSFFKQQNREISPDGLGYISSLLIDDVPIAIMGLDSAWLAEGGLGDYGKLLIGERQVINVLELANAAKPFIILGMSHHPLHLLTEFDFPVVKHRIYQSCRLFHCGHLHEQESAMLGDKNQSCLTLSAGASFETRHLHNAFSIVTLDLLNASCSVENIQYEPRKGSFFKANSESYRFELDPINCGLTELALAISAYSERVSPWAYYLSSLLLDRKADFPILVQDKFLFGSFEVTQALSNDLENGHDLKRETSEFLAFRNVLKVFYKRIPLMEMLKKRGKAVDVYGELIVTLSSLNPDFESRLLNQEIDAKSLAASDCIDKPSFAIAALNDLAEAKDWVLLRDLAQRYLISPIPKVSEHAKRMLALALANSEEDADKSRAIDIYRSLVGGNGSEFSDVGNLVTMLLDTCETNNDEAKSLVLRGIVNFPEKTGYFAEIGEKLVQQTGDKIFRQLLNSAKCKRIPND